MEWDRSIKKNSSLKSINFKELTVEEFMQEQNIESMHEILQNNDLRDVFFEGYERSIIKGGI